jgi:hypothetical protein
MNPLDNRKRVAVFEYDFAKDGGAVGDITLRGGDIPPGALIDFGLIDVVTALTSGGSATIAIKLVSAGDLKAATAVATWALNATLASTAVGTAATTVKTTARVVPVMSVAVAALLTGKFRISLEYTVTR